VDHPRAETEKPEGDFYAYVWTTEEEMRVLKQHLGDFAKLGLIVAVSKPVY